MRQKPDRGETTYVGHGRLRDRVARGCVNNAAFQGKAVESFEDIDAERVERTFINVASIQAYAPSARS